MPNTFDCKYNFVCLGTFTSKGIRIILKKSHSFYGRTLCREKTAECSYKTHKYRVYSVGRLEFPNVKAGGAYIQSLVCVK
jgi:hypothetical protein